MATLTPEQINEIAQELDSGFKCYWNKKSNELLFIPDELRHPDMEIEHWEDDLKKLKKNRKDFKEIPPLEPRDSLKMMREFIGTLSDSNSLKETLLDAMNKSKAFREFKFVIDNSGDYRQKWFDFKNQKLEEWVRERFEEIISPTVALFLATQIFFLLKI